LAEFLESHHTRLNTVLSLVVSNQDIVDRLSKRRINRITGENYHLDFKPPPADIEPGIIVQRNDDLPEATLHRLEIYQESTFPVQEYYRSLGLLQEIEGKGTFEEVYQRILTAIMNSLK